MTGPGKLPASSNARPGIFANRRPKSVREEHQPRIQEKLDSYGALAGCAVALEVADKTALPQN